MGFELKLNSPKLNIKGAKWILPIQKSQSLLESLNPRLEPAKIPINKRQNEAFNLAYATLSAVIEEVRTIILEEKLNSLSSI